MARSRNFWFFVFRKKMFTQLLLLLSQLIEQFILRTLSLLLFLFWTIFVLVRWIATRTRTVAFRYVPLSFIFGGKRRFPSCQGVLVFIFHLVVTRTRVTDVLFVAGKLLNFIVFFLSGVTWSSFSSFSSVCFFHIKVSIWTRGMRILSPFSFLLCYQRTITFAAMTGVSFAFGIIQLIFHLLFSFNEFRHVIRAVESFLASSKTFFFIIPIDDRLVIGRNTSNRQFGESIFNTSFM